MLSVTKETSSIEGVPITLKIIASWSLLSIGKPFFCFFGLDDGESGKQDFPGNRGVLSKKVALFSFIIPRSSAKMQPIDQTSMAGP
jgi:hypothetical protein